MGRAAGRRERELRHASAVGGLFDAAVESYRIFVLNAQDGIPTAPGRRPGDPVRRARRCATCPRSTTCPCACRSCRGCSTCARPPDVVLRPHLDAAREGKVSLGTEVNILPAAIERARARGGLVVAQVNPRMPYTLGDGELDVDDIDLAIEVDEPLPLAGAPARGGR